MLLFFPGLLLCFFKQVFQCNLSFYLGVKLLVDLKLELIVQIYVRLVVTPVQRVFVELALHSLTSLLLEVNHCLGVKLLLVLDVRIIIFGF